MECKGCGVALREGSRSHYCDVECRKKRYKAISDGYSPLRKKAKAVVDKAIVRGELSRLSCTPGIYCVDCGRPAVAYDHRDYAKPLEVEAVCGGCNRRRGPGLNG